MSGPDSFYTPTSLAEQLAGYVTAEKVRSAIDFCVGDGELLKAVAKRYKGVRFFGTDISDEAIEKLKRDCPDWNLGVCDFKDDESVNTVSPLRDRKFDLIMLNPPFTCKGSVVEHAELDEQKFRLSTAMLFLVRALKYLSDDGGLYAILPISCVYSDKDRAIWNYLKSHYNACVLNESDKVYFTKKCSPNIALVYVGHYPMISREIEHQHPFRNLHVTDVVRGCYRMQNPSYSNSRKAIPLIHTTNIQKGRLENLRRVIPGMQLTVDGYGVVIPRVCNPNPGKVALLDGKHTFALSDCVIVLRTATQEDAEQVRLAILNNWQDFVALYKGTGAQYTTVARVKDAFGK